MYRGVIGSQSNQGLRVITIGPKDPVCVSIYTALSEGYSKLSLSKALHRYISLPIASNQSAQLVPGLGSDTVAATNGMRDVKMACAVIQGCKSLDGSITTAFQWLGRASVSYSHRQFTKFELQYV